MKSTEKFVRELLDGWNRKDIAVLESLVNEEVVLVGPLERFEGKAKYLEGAKLAFNNYKEIRIVELFAHEESAIAVLDFEMLLPGGAFVQNCVEYYTMSNGKLDTTVAYYDATELRGYFDLGDDGIPRRKDA